MPLEKVPFKAYRYEEERIEEQKEKGRVISLKFNVDELKLLKDCQEFLNQKKEGTAIKQLLRIGAKVVLCELQGEIMKVVLENKRRNRRSGIYDFE